MGAYADGELSAAEARDVEAHLDGCEACRKALALQRGIRSQLAGEAAPAAGPALWARIRSVLDRAPTLPRTERRTWPLPVGRALPWLGWMLAAVLAGVILLDARPPERASGPVRPPMVEEALADYGRLRRGELPVDPGGIGRVQQQLGFAVDPLTSPEARLIGAWTTELRRQPAAVLAYRWRDRVILQYVVSEELFFRQPAVRERVAAQGTFVVTAGTRSVVAWPGHSSGSLLVGEADPKALQQLRS